MVNATFASGKKSCKPKIALSKLLKWNQLVFFLNHVSERISVSYYVKNESLSKIPVSEICVKQIRVN